MSRFEKHRNSRYECPECGTVQTGTVQVDTLASVAGAKCESCDKTIEPIPVGRQ